MKSIERWDYFEQDFVGPQSGNPYCEVFFEAVFLQKHREVVVNGFYDGEGRYILRFMPDTVGEWHFRTISNVESLDDIQGEFLCVPAAENNHGPVGVSRQFRFAYADGTPYFQIGTTCYAWAHQTPELEALTLKTLVEAPFNKLRMCVFPKDYTYNKNEPQYYAYERNPDETFNFTRFNPAFFVHFETLLQALRELNIEADLILFHPYDRWGFSDMGPEADDLYLRYVTARFSAFRNVWWSMANEFDLMKAKTGSDWDRFFRVVQTDDPYQHLRSVHNCRYFYDHAKPWVTHVSVQHGDLTKMEEWRNQYGKPVVDDECRYEGNIGNRWGNLTARDLMDCFWEGTLRGGYVGHGETYIHPDDILWWSKGGELHGESPARIDFMKLLLADVIQDLQPQNYRTIADGEGGGYAFSSIDERYMIIYCGSSQVGGLRLRLPEGKTYSLDVIDTWEMTTEQRGLVEGKVFVTLPTKTNLALRLVQVD